MTQVSWGPWNSMLLVQPAWEKRSIRHELERSEKEMYSMSFEKLEAMLMDWFALRFGEYLGLDSRQPQQVEEMPGLQSHVLPLQSSPRCPCFSCGTFSPMTFRAQDDFPRLTWDGILRSLELEDASAAACSRPVPPSPLCPNGWPGLPSGQLSPIGLNALITVLAYHNQDDVGVLRAIIHNYVDRKRVAKQGNKKIIYWTVEKLVISGYHGFLAQKLSDDLKVLSSLPSVLKNWRPDLVEKITATINQHFSSLERNRSTGEVLDWKIRETPAPESQQQPSETGSNGGGSEQAVQSVHPNAEEPMAQSGTEDEGIRLLPKTETGHHAQDSSTAIQSLNGNDEYPPHLLTPDLEASIQSMAQYEPEGEGISLQPGTETSHRESDPQGSDSTAATQSPKGNGEGPPPPLPLIDSEASIPNSNGDSISTMSIQSSSSSSGQEEHSNGDSISSMSVQSGSNSSGQEEDSNGDSVSSIRSSSSGQEGCD